MSHKKPTIDEAGISRYLIYLKEQERSAATIRKYAHDLRMLCGYLEGGELTKAALIDWKQELVDAFRTVKPGEYDGILMDVQMPLMNGLDAARAIRSGENPLGKTIPILAMTANAFAEDIRNSLAAGMDAHISKPIDIRVLKREMSRFVTPPLDSGRGRWVSARNGQLNRN